MGCCGKSELWKVIAIIFLLAEVWEEIYFGGGEANMALLLNHHGVNEGFGLTCAAPP